MLKNSAILAFLLGYKKEPLDIKSAKMLKSVKPNLKHSTICSNKDGAPCSVPPP